MKSILEQIKRRRKALKYTQEQMMLRIGMSRQQYQRLESQGNPTLETLSLIAKGLKMELMLIPVEKLDAVNAILEGRTIGGTQSPSIDLHDDDLGVIDPWKDLLDDDL